MILDASLCIPTYNRAGLLDKCLQHLLTFSSTGFEIIIGDNASEDSTPEVVAKYIEKFDEVKYLRHSENIGFARNMDSVLRLAKKKYVYIISDDDLIFEGALELIVKTMDMNQSISGMVGSYISQCVTELGMKMDYSDTTVSIIDKGNYSLLANNLNVCDGHPIMRRDVFQRFCNYTHRVNLIPLYFQLIAIGCICRINKPLFQHLRNSDSLTSNMSEQWFIDLANADIEVALSVLPNANTKALDIVRNRLLKNIYHQAARMAINRDDYLLFWHFVKRFKSLGDTPDGFLVKCEKNFLVKVAAQRIANVAKDTDVRCIYYDDSHLLKLLVGTISEFLENKIELVPFDKNTSLTHRDMLLVENVDRFGITPNIGQEIAVFDIINSFRLTPHSIILALGQDNVNVIYTDPGVRSLEERYSLAFERVCLPYSGT